MKKFLILALSIIILGLISCNKEYIKTIKDTSSNNYTNTINEDLEIVEWSFSSKEPHNPDKNIANFMGGITINSKDSMHKKAVSINLKKGQSLRIETKVDKPITIMLKDNSNENYLFNKTLVPINNTILIDKIEKDGQYELMADFNNIDEFKFKVYLVN